MKTAWRGMVSYKGEGYGWSGCSFSGATFPEAMQSMFSTVAYYMGLGYQTVKVDCVDEYCVMCGGTGEVQKERGRGKKRCPDCKGKGEVTKLPGFVPKVSDATKIVTE